LRFSLERVLQALPMPQNGVTRPVLLTPLHTGSPVVGAVWIVTDCE
jgi:hypothetical protein